MRAPHPTLVTSVLTLLILLGLSLMPSTCVGDGSSFERAAARTAFSDAETQMNVLTRVRPVTTTVGARIDHPHLLTIEKVWFVTFRWRAGNDIREWEVTEEILRNLQMFSDYPAVRTLAGSALDAIKGSK